ncbi:hypothetical protein KBX06_14560 [Micromonospora sp. C31]|uniref:helix-hairpin-helix domain-containing protein n=1 Tax=Micromonospora sp. C31 TaxID=2824876 RepID=UPI001B37A9ED|nr:helix-hairpin-helix domain-containing protein [Micromonospora sp. C31]MBQ1074376.1 hypothetical protein [Micromonospora sp. C31]
MAWSFGHWLILIVALVVGVAGGWFLRDRRDTASATHRSPSVDGDPVAGMTAVVVDPPPVATLDEARPEATVDRTPDAVADGVPAPAGADAPTDAAPSATVVAADAPRADDVDPAEIALTGDPVPAPETDPAPAGTATDARPEHETVLPAAAEVTGPVDGRPAHEPADPQHLPTGAAEPAPAAVTPAPASPTPAEPETAPVAVAAAPAEPEPAVTTAVEPAVATATVDGTATAADAPVEPESTPVVPAPRGEVPAPAATDSDAPDDFRRIQGVGPKMAAALQAAGIRTYRQLAELDETALRETIRAAGLRAAPSLATWPQQAKVLAAAPQEAVAALPTPVGGQDA